MVGAAADAWGADSFALGVGRDGAGRDGAGSRFLHRRNPSPASCVCGGRRRFMSPRSPTQMRMRVDKAP
jgi:hypothetical protein